MFLIITRDLITPAFPPLPRSFIIVINLSGTYSQLQAFSQTFKHTASNSELYAAVFLFLKLLVTNSLSIVFPTKKQMSFIHAVPITVVL